MFLTNVFVYVYVFVISGACFCVFVYVWGMFFRAYTHLPVICLIETYLLVKITLFSDVSDVSYSFDWLKITLFSDVSYVVACLLCVLSI